MSKKIIKRILVVLGLVLSSVFIVKAYRYATGYGDVIIDYRLPVCTPKNGITSPNEIADSDNECFNYSSEQECLTASNGGECRWD